MKPLTDDEYISKQGSICPACRSDNIEGEDIEVTSGGTYQNCWCLDCHARWVDCYALCGYSDLEKGSSK
jgi:hypothetical protein